MFVNHAGSQTSHHLKYFDRARSKRPHSLFYAVHEAKPNPESSIFELSEKERLDFTDFVEIKRIF
tara:strand:+ start:11821 stop:12015 length:195 start_codon:yes stop_codon:yes gene_type:complete